MSALNPLAAAAPAAPLTSWHPPREGREHDLRTEQVVRATVAEGGQGRVLLEMDQRRYWAETGLPLKTGQSLSLMVMATAPRLELKVVGDPLADRLGHLLHLLGGSWELPGVLARLTAQPSVPALAAGRDVLERVLGLLTTTADALTGENLRDLLGHLVSARARQEDPAGGSVAAFREALRVAHRQLAASNDPGAEEIHRLLQQQELALLCQARLAQGGMSFFPLPLPLVENGYLLIERRSGEREEEKNSKLSLYLTLAGLGDLRIDFLYEAQGLFLRFCCGSPATMSFLAQFHDELKAGFQTYPLRGVAFVTGAESPNQALVRRLRPDGEGMLNTRV